MHVFISYVCQVFNSCFIAFLCSRCLGCKYRKAPTILLFTAFSAVSFWFKFYSFPDSSVLMTAVLLYECGLYLFVLAAFQAPLFHRLLFGSLLYMICLFIENLLLVSMQLLGVDTHNLTPASSEYFIFSMIGFAGNLVADFYFAFLWRRIFCGGNTKRLLYFALLPLSGIFLCQLMLVPFLLKKRQDYTLSLAVSTLLVPILCLLLFLLLLRRLEKKDIHEACLELELLHEAEQLRYDALEAHRDELAKLRHDYNNQLTAIHSLLSSQRYGEAYELASSLRQAMQNARKPLKTAQKPYNETNEADMSKY